MPIDVGSALYLSYTYYTLLLQILTNSGGKIFDTKNTAVTCKNYSTIL